MTAERLSMKLIRINKTGKTTAQFFDFSLFSESCPEENCYREIELIEKDDVLDILNYIMENDEVSYDEFDSEVLQNPAQKLIYKELYQDFEELKENKKAIIAQIDKEFETAEKKYIDNEE